MVTVRWTFKAVCVSVCVCGSDKYISKHEHVARHSASVSAHIVQRPHKCECLHCAAVCREGSPVATSHPHCSLRA